MDMKQGYRLNVSHDPKKPLVMTESSAAADLAVSTARTASRSCTCQA
jgi:hypothetical protein